MFLFTPTNVFKYRIFLRAVLVAILAITIFPALVAESKIKTAANAVVESAPLSPPPGTSNIKYDFDGDGKADVGRWHGGNTEFKTVNAAGVPSIYTLGASYWKAAPGDFDGDGKTDAGVYYGGTWTYKTSPTATALTITHGAYGDVLVAGDYDYDGKTDAAVFTPSTNVWSVKESLSGNIVTTTFGQAGDIPIPGDFTGDGKTDFALYRPGSNASTFQIRPYGGGADFTITWGLPNDVPVQGDFDGDGVSDAAIYRPVDGNWWIRSSFNGSTMPVQMWGNYADQPVPADYDGDSKTDLAVWRPTTGEWLMLYSNPANGTGYAVLGVPGDMAVESAYTKQVGGSVAGSELAAARLRPRNATGGTDLYSQNFSWGTSLASLPGRSGMDASLGIGYNSLNWINVNGTMYFDPDTSNVSPGFRFGLPVIEPIYYSGMPKKSWSFIMVTPSGRRVEFRQSKGKAGHLYLAVDSSYTTLTTSKFVTGPTDPVEDVTPVITTTDGTRMIFAWKTGAYRCTKITDRNGNVISANYDTAGRLTKLTDTLSREINVNYDTVTHHPTSIQQNWKTNNGQGPGDDLHNWATFSYTNQTVNTNFSIPSFGPPNGASVKTLERITYADGSSTRFLYNGYLQVKTVENWATDNHRLNYVTTDLASVSGSQSDTPRFTETKTWAKDFNNDAEVTSNYTQSSVTNHSLGGQLVSGTRIQSAVAGHPNSLISNAYVSSSGWSEGLPLGSEDCEGSCGGSNTKRWTWNEWTQDGGLLINYVQNPRLIETKVGDGTNTKRTTIGYVTGGDLSNGWSLPQTVTVYDAAGTGVMKQSLTTYNTSANYTARRMIALPAQVDVSGKNDLGGVELVSRQTFAYDENGYTGGGQNVSPTQHDGVSYGSSHNHRGNLTKVTRHDVLNSSTIPVSQTIFNTAGSPISQTTPWDGTNTRTVSIAYTDNFNGYTGAATYAYPTMITDPASYSSTVQYRYDIGANVSAVSPNGKTTTRIFDTVGRLEKQSLFAGSTPTAYTRYSRPNPDNGKEAWTYSTLVDTPGSTAGPDTADEVLTETLFDGAGHAYQSRSPHTFNGNGSTATYSGTKVEFDKLGRVVRQYVPAEIGSNWALTGTDDTAWHFTSTEYDWKGRPLKTYPDDSNGNDGKESVFSYQGCGCAGGMITTAQGPMVPRDDQPTVNARRTQKSYADILGRPWKTEAMNWDGGVYSTTTVQFNGRDQTLNATLTEAATSVSQTTWMTYDGHGRLKTQHVPQQDTNAVTTYNYNADDRVQSVMDARGASTNYVYGDARGLVSQVNYTVPLGSPIPVPSPVNFQYDNVGNRTQMTDGMGTQTYQYNSLSQMTSETRAFNESMPSAPQGNNSFQLTYTYHLGGELKSITEPFGVTANYALDKAGRLTGVAPSTTYGYTNSFASNAQYRAWGGLKHLEYGNGTQMNQTFDPRLQPDNYILSDSQGQLMNKSYDYYDDGKLKFVDDALNWRFRRLNTYDHQGRIKAAKSSLEATGTEINGTQQLTDLPYRQTYTYNAFGDMTERYNKMWGNDIYLTKTYNFTNQRITTGPLQNPWGYDADGRATLTGDPDTISEMTYDAGGQMRLKHDKPAPTLREDKLIRYNNGDGRELKRVTEKCEIQNNDPTCTWMGETPSYYVRSTVLGGEVIAEVGNGGLKHVRYVRAGGVILAHLKENPNWGQGGLYDAAYFEQTDAAGMSFRTTKHQAPFGYGDYSDLLQGEFDPANSNVGTVTTYNPPPGPPNNPPVPLENESPLYINGEFVSATVDGVAMNWQAVRNMANAEILFAGGLPVEMRAGHLFIPTRRLEFNGNWEGPEDMFTMRRGGDMVISAFQQQINEPLGPPAPPSQEQLLKCLRDFLRPFFGNVQLGNFKTLSPVDDARFIAVPGLGKVAAAMTAGLYDIFYDPKLVDLTGGADKSSIGTIAEEIAHTVQFIAVWEQVETNTGVSGSYNRAMASWGVGYFSDSGRVLAGNLAKATSLWMTGVPERLGDLYRDNKYEKEAQDKRRAIQEKVDKLAKSPCYP